jgi:hypothetical protein
MWLLFLFFVTSFIILTTLIKLSNNKQSIKIELDEYNTLLYCESCGKLHRKYQEELHLIIDQNYKTPLTCPLCYESSSIYTGKEYRWLKNNPECPELDKKDLKKIKKTIKNTKQLVTEDQSIKKFLHYYQLLETQPKQDDK